ncbi:NIPSNAP protein [Mucilaginibacter mallensis]|uniref:NIPSNAP protein n=1 Tax=Mucilaginibacter mallensis TaxID=652787 RepID=A0A1H2BLC4_MUCMA|nr:NIPSNAP family protein [Mucilaginibacter mallensis]SDT59043.1 NIPSNAP protein [Mucilaginibacter mallensis]
MKRRSFVKASILTGAASTVLPGITMAANSSKKSGQQLYELRVYTLKTDTQQKLVEDYLQNAAIPALNRLGSNPIGVFTELKPDVQTRIFVLIPYKSADDFLKVQDKLMADSTYLQQASAYLNAPLSAPAYDRIESSLLQAFKDMPKLETPGQQKRIFELRRYESPTEASGKKKIEMFNEAGEIGIFKRLGFKPVFYSETLIGTFRPNLVYMITFDDMDAHDHLWKAFGNDPDWKKISTSPEYPNEIVSHITSTMLVPAGYSQI